MHKTSKKLRNHSLVPVGQIKVSTPKRPANAERLGTPKRQKFQKDVKVTTTIFCLTCHAAGRNSVISDAADILDHPMHELTSIQKEMMRVHPLLHEVRKNISRVQGMIKFVQEHQNELPEKIEHIFEQVAAHIAKQKQRLLEKQAAVSDNTMLHLTSLYDDLQK